MKKEKGRPYIMIFACVAALGTLAGWAAFRYNHMLSAYAFVKGAVVTVGTPIDCRIASVEVRSGQRVQAGQLLVRLDDTRQLAAVAQAQAAWEQASLQVYVERASLKVLQQKSHVMSKQYRAMVEANQAEARAAKIDAKLATLQAERSTSLRKRDMVPQSESDIAVANRGIAQEKVERAHSHVARAEAELGNVLVEEARVREALARVSLLEAAAKTAHAALERAEAELALTRVHSSRAGVVSRRLVEPGAAVRVGGPLLEMWYDDTITIEAWMDESKFGNLSVGAPVKARLVGLDSTVFAGHVEWLGVVSDLELKNASFSIPIAKQLAQSHWVRVQVALERPDPRLLPGLTVEVSIPRPQKGTAIIAPSPRPVGAGEPVARSN
jgi:multidrug resistance efflux pump